MKAIFLLPVLIAAAALADDITTLTGQTFRNVKISSSDPISISFMHSSGAGRVLFVEIDAELQKKYGYDAAKAASYLEALKAKRAEQPVKPSADYAPPFVEKPEAPVQAEVTEPKASESVGNVTEDTTPTGKKIYVGPRGGRYHYSASGKKVYERKK